MKLLLQIFKTMEKSEFRVLIKHCFLIGKILFKQSNDLISVIWTLLHQKQVKRWYADFKCSRTDTNDAERSGHPNLAVVPVNTNKLHKLVLADCKLKLCEIAKNLKIAGGSIFTILHEHLSMRNSIQSGCHTCSQLIKNNNTMTIQSIVCNCFNTTKRSFC